MWTLKFCYGCWCAENEYGQEIWSKDKTELENLFDAAGYELKTELKD